MNIGKYRAQFRKAKNPITDGPSTRESVMVANRLKEEQDKREAEAKARMDALRARNAK